MEESIGIQPERIGSRRTRPIPLVDQRHPALTGRKKRTVRCRINLKPGFDGDRSEKVQGRCAGYLDDVIHAVERQRSGITANIRNRKKDWGRRIRVMQDADAGMLG